MEFDITTIIVFVLGALFTGLGALLPGLSARIKAWRKETIPAGYDWLLDELADIGVKAAQQVYQDADGPAKLAYAKNYVKVAAKGRGIVFDDKVIETTIEAKVYDLKRLLELRAD
jgi:hypothetical protein